MGRYSKLEDVRTDDSTSRKSLRTPKGRKTREIDDDSLSDAQSEEEVSSRKSVRSPKKRKTRDANDDSSNEEPPEKPTKTNRRSSSKKSSGSGDSASAGDEEESDNEIEKSKQTSNELKRKSRMDNGKNQGTKRKSRQSSNSSVSCDEQGKPEGKEAASDSDDDQENLEPEKKNSATKSSKKSKKAVIPEEHSENYEVLAVVSDRVIKGRVQYKIRWKGYNSDDDTWENESHLDCMELIEEYNDSKKNGNSSNSRSPLPKKAKSKKPSNKKKTKDTKHQGYTRDGPTPNGEWEVLRIIDMHIMKKGSREFLVRWKGYPPEDDSWEPEENLRGTDLLHQFLEKVDKAKEVPGKELRAYRSVTDRYTAMPQGHLRRESKRFINKQRIKYYDAE